MVTKTDIALAKECLEEDGRHDIVLFIENQEATIKGQCEQIADLQNALIGERARANRAETYIRSREKGYPMWGNFDVKSPYLAEAREQLLREGIL